MMDVTGCQFALHKIPEFWWLDMNGFECERDRIFAGTGPFEMAHVGGLFPRWDESAVRTVGQLTGLPKPFLAVPVPQTSLEHLAASVLMNEPCGAHLVDCLIETQSVDVDAEVQRQIRAKALEHAAALVRVRMLNTGGSVRVALQSVVDAIEGLM